MRNFIGPGLRALLKRSIRKVLMNPKIMFSHTLIHYTKQEREHTTPYKEQRPHLKTLTSFVSQKTCLLCVMLALSVLLCYLLSGVCSSSGHIH